MINNKEKINIEREFINLLLSNKDFAGQWVEFGPKIDFFDDIHQPILHAIQYAFNNDVLLTKKTLLDYLKRNQFKRVDIQTNEQLFDRITTPIVAVDEYPNLRNKIIEAHIEHNTVSYITQYDENEGKIGSVASATKLRDQLDSLIEVSTLEKPLVYEPIDQYAPEFVEELLARLNNKEETSVKCHIKDIDDVTGQGFFPGTLTLVCGDVGSFKSTLMLNLGLNIWKYSKKNVLFVPLEMPRDKLYQKLLSRETGISFDKFDNTELLSQDEWAKVKTFHKQWEELDYKFYLMDVPERVPVSMIRRAIEKNIKIFKPDVVIVDYIANLVAEKKSRAERDDIVIGNIIKDLRFMGRKNSLHSGGFAVISAAQIGREALKRVRKNSNKASFFSEDLRGSHEYSMDADWIFALMPDVQQPDKKLYVFIVKSRYGRKTFLNGSTKALLEVEPEISLIKSVEDEFFKVHKKDILAKIDDNILDFSKDILDEQPDEFDDVAAAKELEVVATESIGDNFDREFLNL